MNRGVVPVFDKPTFARQGGGARWRGAALALCVQAVLASLLLLGLSPAARRQVAQSALAAFSTPASPPPPAPHSAPRAAPAPAAQQGAAGVHAVSRSIVAPVPPVVLTLPPAPHVASSGAANTSGMRNEGTGPGAGVSGNGGGNGAGGAGQGGGGTPLAQIAGSIDSARDYPRAGRDARIGHSALIVFTVGVDGRAHDCQIRESSGDPESDAITCRLALERFRFRPATDASGQPVEHIYGWRQKWFY